MCDALIVQVIFDFEFSATETESSILAYEQAVVCDES
jgi:hypothetical protein